MSEELKFEPTAESLLAILERLRAPGGCPWDREQTRLSLSRSLAEECAELLDAIDRDDPADICDELGDLFMNVLFQAVIAKEKGEFTYTDMAGHIVEKMVRRHAHIFGDAEAGTAEEVTDLWAKIKEKEKAVAGKPRETSILDGVGHYLTSLNRAEKIQKKVAKVGFDWSDQQGIVGTRSTSTRSSATCCSWFRISRASAGGRLPRSCCGQPTGSSNPASVISSGCWPGRAFRLNRPAAPGSKRSGARQSRRKKRRAAEARDHKEKRRCAMNFCLLPGRRSTKPISGP